MLNVERLDLEGNCIQNKGFQLLCDLLIDNKSLKELVRDIVMFVAVKFQLTLQYIIYMHKHHLKPRFKKIKLDYQQLSMKYLPTKVLATWNNLSQKVHNLMAAFCKVDFLFPYIFSKNQLKTGQLNIFSVVP